MQSLRLERSSHCFARLFPLRLNFKFRSMLRLPRDGSWRLLAARACFCCQRQDLHARSTKQRSLLQ
jgi:hypothetical protein